MVEIVAALAILGVLFALLGQAQWFGLSARARQIRTLATEGDLESVDRLLRRLVTAIDAAGMHGTTPGFAGSAHTIAFTSIVRVPGFDTREVDASLNARPESGLELSLQPHYRRVLGPRPLPVRQLVLPGVTRLDISYAGAGGAWRSEWRTPDLPRLIRFHLVFDAASGERWPDIVVSPMRDPWRP